MLVRLFVMCALVAVLPLSAKEADVTELRGRIVDAADSTAIEFANVSAVDGDGKIIAICSTDEEGRFRLLVYDGGTYDICLTFIGYHSAVRRGVVCDGHPVELGAVALERSSEELSAASISEKVLIRREADRIVYDVLSDPDAGRLDMAAFMSKIPGLVQSVADGKLEYRNMKISSILIDDRTSPLINGNRQYPMSFIRADHMSRIELVLPGSPEYGNSEPILLVTLSRELPFGAAAELSGSAETLNEYAVKPDAVVHLPAVGIGLSYDFGYSHNPSLTDRTVRTVTGTSQDTPYGNTVETSSERRSEQQTHNLKMDLFRSFLDDRLDLNVTLATNGSGREDVTKTNTVRTASDAVTSVEPSSSLSRYDAPFRLSAGASVSYRWSEKGSAGLKYTMSRKESSETDFIDWFQGVADRANVGTTSSLEQNVSADVLYRHSPALSVKGAAGYMYRDYVSSSEYWTGAVSGMDYVQGVAYLTASLSGAFRKAGLRYALSANVENVCNRGTDTASGSDLDYDDFNVVPRLSLSWRAWKSGTLSAGYTVRTSRPRQEMLNPAADVSDPENIFVGNPDLKGEVRHMAEIGLDQDFRTSWLKNISLDASYSAVPDAIERLSYSDASGVRTTTYANIGKREELGASLSIRFSITKAASLSLSAKAGRRSYTMQDRTVNVYWTFSGMAIARINLKYLTILQTFMLMPSISDAQTRTYSMYPDWNINIGRYFGKLKLGVNLYCSDVLHGRNSVFSGTSGPGFYDMCQSGRPGRSFGISAYWRIGRFKSPPTVSHSSYDLE